MELGLGKDDEIIQVEAIKAVHVCTGKSSAQWDFSQSRHIV